MVQGMEPGASLGKTAPYTLPLSFNCEWWEPAALSALFALSSHASNSVRPRPGIFACSAESPRWGSLLRSFSPFQLLPGSSRPSFPTLGSGKVSGGCSMIPKPPQGISKAQGFLERYGGAIPPGSPGLEA
jgi:hypothetical protein